MYLRPSLLVSLALAALHLAGCRSSPSPADDSAPPAASSFDPTYAPPGEEERVKDARDRGTYQATSQIRMTTLAPRLAEAEDKVRAQPAKLQALNDANQELYRSFKAVESSGQAEFPAARDRHEAAYKKLDALIKDAK